MPYIIIVILIALAGVLFFFFQPASAGDPQKPSPKTSVTQVKVSKSRESIASRLKNLIQSAPPESLSRGAMCYDMVGPPDRAEYVCPKCGEKTLYSKNSGLVTMVLNEIPASRRIVGTIEDQDVKVTIDESAFCKKCSPGTAKPRLCMTVAYSGDTLRNTTCGITSNDVLIVSEFLLGSKKHKNNFDEESPLKNRTIRLIDLLKVEIDWNKK